MVVATTFKARLRFTARNPGVLNWDASSHEWRLPTGHQAVLQARHADTLVKATDFHIDVCGFTSPDAAMEVGEKLRNALRLANVVLGVGLHIPATGEDRVGTRLGPQVKEKIAAEHGITLVDSVFGLSVLKDGEQLEFSSRGGLSAIPESSTYVLEAVAQLWDASDESDELSRLACDLLNAAARDPSWRSRFLITFLALDVLLERRERPEAAQRVIAQLRKVVETSDLNAAEKARLMSALGNLRTTSLAAEIERFASLGANATHEVQGERLPDFLEACLKLRHKLAHPPASNRNSIADGELSGRVNGLTQVVLGIIWARNNLPPFSVNRPRDIVRVSELQISVF